MQRLDHRRYACPTDQHAHPGSERVLHLDVEWDMFELDTGANLESVEVLRHRALGVDLYQELEPPDHRVGRYRRSTVAPPARAVAVELRENTGTRATSPSGLLASGSSNVRMTVVSLQRSFYTELSGADHSSPKTHWPAGSTAACGGLDSVVGSAGAAAVASAPFATVVTFAPLAVNSFVEVAITAAPLLPHTLAPP